MYSLALFLCLLLCQSREDPGSVVALDLSSVVAIWIYSVHQDCINFYNTVNNTIQRKLGMRAYGACHFLGYRMRSLAVGRSWSEGE